MMMHISLGIQYLGKNYGRDNIVTLVIQADGTPALDNPHTIEFLEHGDDIDLFILSFW
jgi:hypothetical protein